MESGTQTNLLSYLTIENGPVNREQTVDTSTQTFVNEDVRYVYVSTVEPVNVQATVEEDYMDEEDDADKKNKVRERHPENWRQEVRKRNKNKGLAYVKANGEVCAKKEMGPPCTCLMKCYDMIGKEACLKIFNNFWKLGDYSLQNAYLAGCVHIVLPKYMSKKIQRAQPARRFYSRNFYVNVNGIDTEVCKQAFLSLHAVSNGRLDRLLKKKQETGNTGIDERGRHNNKVNKIPLEKIRDVRRSIDGFRKRAGFTGKRKSKNVEILPVSLNIRSMYKVYREEMLQKGKEPVCEFRYRKIFHADFHLDFARSPPIQSLPAKPQPTQQSSCQQQTVTPVKQVQISPSKPQISQQQLQPLPTAQTQPLKKKEVVELTTVDYFDEKPVYTMLETKDGGSTYVTLSQDLYPWYNMQQQSWLFPAQN